MVWAALGTAAASYLSSQSQGGGGGVAPALMSEGGDTTVNVGGLNVPAFPSFPNYSATTAAGSTMSLKPNNDLLLYAVGGMALIALLKRR